MEIYNQYRIKAIPKEEISKVDVLRIVRECCKVVEDSDELITVKYRYGANIAYQWDISVDDKGETNDLVIENLEDPFSRFGVEALWAGRKLAQKIQSWIKDWIQEEES